MRCYATETMTCVGRYIGKALKLNGKVFHYAVYRDGLTEDLYVTAGWQDETETADITGYIKLGVGGSSQPFTAMDGWDTPVCRIPWDTNPDSIEIWEVNSWANMTNGMIETSAVDVYQSRFESLPSLSAAEVKLYADYTHPLTWTLTPGDDRIGWVTGVQYRYRSPGEEVFTTVPLYQNTRLSACQAVLGAEVLGKEVCLAIEYRTYPADWNGSDPEDFTTLNRYVTPVQQVDRLGSVPLGPGVPAVSLLLDGGKVTVSWQAVEDPLYPGVSWTLERAAVGADGVLSGYSVLYTGTSARFRDSLPAGLTAVQYRVRTVSADGAVSPWAETALLPVAQSNVYVGTGGRWLRAAAVRVGSHAASPLFVTGGK